MLTGQSVENDPTFTRSFDDLVGEPLKMQRHVKAECLGGFEVDDEIELGRDLDRQIAGLRSTQDAIDMGGRAPEHVFVVRSV
jgi:hypothetical protein